MKEQMESMRLTELKPEKGAAVLGGQSYQQPSQLNNNSVGDRGLIYRDYGCTLSQKNCANLLQSLALTKGSIVSQFTFNNGFPESSVGRWQMFFRLRFRDQEALDRFHAMGFKTTAAEIAKGQ